jgi:hypothetical protein
MALELHEQLSEALQDVLRGGWAKYLELEDGTQVQATWHQELDLRWLQVTNLETGHAANFRVHVAVEALPPIGPEDDGALRAELAAEAGPVEATWGSLCEGDQAIGEDGQPYLVEQVREGIGPQAGKVVVTMVIGGQARPYAMDPAGAVKVLRGAAGRAAQALLEAGMDPRTVRS